VSCRWLAPIMIALALLAGCAANRDRPATYVVKRGDTLYSIATRHNLDYRDVARWNRIGRDYVIRPGQVLRLYPPDSRTARASASPPAASGRQTPPKTTAPGSSTRSSSSTPRSAPAASGPPIKWQWPVTGGTATLTTRPNGGHGLTIAGRLGQEIRAASSGKVVYTGSGLLGYGQLVIVKHNETYLSAYGHLQSVLIAEGETVSAGQRIATMGNGPQGSPQLYFEIRINGTPGNPLALLPQR
jgi:lipoprotein NlpD